LDLTERGLLGCLRLPAKLVTFHLLTGVVLVFPEGELDREGLRR